MLGFILWDVDPEIFTIGKVAPRWYGLLFALGFLIGYKLMTRFYKDSSLKEEYVDKLTIYALIATIVGARLGHVLFYDLSEYLADPIRILFIWEGGLASHGAAFALIFAVWLYARKTPVVPGTLWVLDRVVITVALAGCFIRLGNLINSEIIGKPTNGSYGFVFVSTAKEIVSKSTEGDALEITDVSFTKTGKDSINANNQALCGLEMTMTIKNIIDGNYRGFVNHYLPSIFLKENTSISDHLVLPQGDIFVRLGKSSPGAQEVTVRVFGIPRHPTQIYESFTSLLIFVFLLFVYSRKKAETPHGRLFGLFTVMLFTLRFVHEFAKEPQENFENELPFNMGQILSIPLILFGLWALYYSYKFKGKTAEIKSKK